MWPLLMYTRHDTTNDTMCELSTSQGAITRGERREGKPGLVLGPPKHREWRECQSVSSYAISRHCEHTSRNVAITWK